MISILALFVGGLIATDERQITAGLKPCQHLFLEKRCVDFCGFFMAASVHGVIAVLIHPHVKPYFFLAVDAPGSRTISGFRTIKVFALEGAGTMFRSRGWENSSSHIIFSLS
jgi:hypothetical protein